MIEIAHAYAFLGGAFVGRFTGIIPSAIISGMMFYMADSSIFSSQNITSSKDIIVGVIKNIKW